MFHIRQKSGWTFETSAGTSLSYDAFAAGKGNVWLNRPTGTKTQFGYASGGIGAGVSISITGPFGISGSTTDHPSVGEVYILTPCPGIELTADDFTGFCVIQEVSGAFVRVSGSVTMMLVGIPATSLPKEVVKRLLWLPLGFEAPEVSALDLVIATAGWSIGGLIGLYAGYKMSRKLSFLMETNAKALLIIGGGGEGLQVGAGLSSQMGYMWLGSEPEISLADQHLVPSLEETSMKSNAIAQDDVIVLPADMLFAFNESKIRTEAYASLVTATALLASKTYRRLRLEGHTDFVGSSDYNQGLSERRAEAVRRWLVDNKIVTEDRVETVGFGLTRPVASNLTREGRQLNRRVEIRMLR